MTHSEDPRCGKDPGSEKDGVFRGHFQTLVLTRVPSTDVQFQDSTTECPETISALTSTETLLPVQNNVGSCFRRDGERPTLTPVQDSPRFLAVLLRLWCLVPDERGSGTISTGRTLEGDIYHEIHPLLVVGLVPSWTGDVTTTDEKSN